MGIVVVARFAASAPGCSVSHDDIDSQTSKLGRQFREASVFSICPTILDDDVLAFGVTEVAQPVAKRVDPRCPASGRTRAQESNAPGLCRWLREGGKRRDAERK